jgi:hypothetical protein
VYDLSVDLHFVSPLENSIFGCGISFSRFIWEKEMKQPLEKLGERAGIFAFRSEPYIKFFAPSGLGR